MAKNNNNSNTLFSSIDALVYDDGPAHASNTHRGSLNRVDTTRAAIRYKDAPTGTIIDPDAMRPVPWEDQGKANVDIINNLTREQRNSIYMGAKNNLIQDYGVAGGDETYFNYMKGYIGSFLYSPYDQFDTGSSINLAEYLALNGGNVVYQGIQVLDGADTVLGAIKDVIEQNAGVAAAYWDHVNVRPELRDKWEIHDMVDPLTGKKFKVASGFTADGDFEVKYLENKYSHPNDPEITIEDINKYNTYADHGAPQVDSAAGEYDPQNPASRGDPDYPDRIHTYANFSCGGWWRDDSFSESNAAAENVTCRLSTTLGKPLGKQEGWIYHGKKTVTITLESLGWTAGWMSDFDIQNNINSFQTSAGNVLGGWNTNDGVPYAPHVTKNQGHDLFQPYKATSYTIEADHYSHWYWVLKSDVNGKYVMESKIRHTGPKTLCNGLVLEGETSHPGHEGHSTHPAQYFDEWNSAWEKWTDDSYFNAVVTGIGHDDVIKLQEDNTDFIPEPPMPPEPPIPEPPITVTAFKDTIPLTKRPKSKGGTRYKVVDDYEVVECNGNIVPKHDFILTDHNCLQVLRPPPCEVIVNVTWKEPEPVAKPDAIAPPEFDPSIMPTFLVSSLTPYRNYEEFIKFKKEMLGSYYEGFDLMGDSAAGMPIWDEEHQASADLEWSQVLMMQAGYESDFTNYTYTPGAGDLIYDEPHQIWTHDSAANHFGDYTNASGVIEDWSGIPTNTNLPATIRNVSSVTTFVEGLWTYDKVTFEHNCPACADDLTTYPSNTWLKYEVYYNGVSL
jgi:hypothetical protein